MQKAWTSSRSFVWLQSYDAIVEISAQVTNEQRARSVQLRPGTSCAVRGLAWLSLAYRTPHGKLLELYYHGPGSYSGTSEGPNGGWRGLSSVDTARYHGNGIEEANMAKKANNECDRGSTPELHRHISSLKVEYEPFRS